VLKLADLDSVDDSQALAVSCLDVKPVSVGISKAEAVASLSLDSVVAVSEGHAVSGAYQSEYERLTTQT
jgi:hypothetical protein